MATSPLVQPWLARADDQRIAIHDGGGATTWRALVDMSERAAATLLDGRRSLEGERVAVLVSPGAAFAAVFFGVLRAGGAVVVLSPLHPPPEIRFFCDDAGVRTVVASPDLAPRVESLAPERRVLLTTAITAGSRAQIHAAPIGDDAALQLYTSGTTGKPKGAIISHANVAVQQKLLRDAWGLTGADVLLHVLPLHHMHGLAIALLPAIGAGAATRFVATTPFDAAAVWEAMSAATVFMAVPTIYARLFATLDGAGGDAASRWRTAASSLRLATSGSAALPTGTGERWRALTGAYPLERFGMTEIGVGLSNPLEAARRQPGMVGAPLPTVSARVLEGGAEADRGELWIAGPSVFSGYHRRPEADREAFVIDAGQRWFKTGDTVERDAHGRYRVLGRTSVDILKSGGYKLSALEIEEALREHPAVAEVAVVGVPDEAWGDRVVACVVARQGRDEECREAQLRAFVKERLAAYKVPRQVVAMAELPRNALGKVLKPELVRRLRSG